MTARNLPKMFLAPEPGSGALAPVTEVRRRFTDRPPHSGGFVVCVRTLAPEFDAAAFTAEDGGTREGDGRRCLLGRTLAVSAAVDGDARMAVCPRGRRLAVVLGEVHGSGQCPATALVQSGTELNAEFARGLNGSWAIFTFDADRDEAALATDRLGSRRVFHGRESDAAWFASSLDRHPLHGGRVDPVAIGWYLTHGAIYGNRTLYEAVRILPPSTVARVSASGLSTQRYWTPSFSATGSAGDVRRSLQAEFGDLLVDAVRCRVGGPGPLWLSLSAGYDAAGIAGILGERIRHPDVACFSYARGPVRKDSDESISAQTAARLGYRHEVLTSYRGDYGSWLETNARASWATAGLCDEVDAWATLASRMTGPTAAILVGDECLGWTDYALKRPADALRAAQIEGGGHLKPARRVLTDAGYEWAAAGIEADIQEMLATAPPFADLHDLKDYFYITQRAPNYILPWRQNFANRVGSVRFPLLDSRVLDFMANVPAALRRQKALYRRTIRQLCPTTFSLPRATSASYHVDHTAEFASGGQAFMPLVSPALVEMVTPTLQEALSAAAIAGNSASPRQSLYKVVVKAIKHTSVGDLLRKAQPAPPVRNPSAAELFTRLFCLDRALASGAILCRQD